MTNLFDEKTFLIYDNYVPYNTVKEVVDYFQRKSEDFDLNVKKYSKENGLASTYIYSSNGFRI